MPGKQECHRREPDARDDSGAQRHRPVSAVCFASSIRVLPQCDIGGEFKIVPEACSIWQFATNTNGRELACLQQAMGTDVSLRVSPRSMSCELAGYLSEGAWDGGDRHATGTRAGA